MKNENRAGRTATGLVVETARLAEAFDRMYSQAELLAQVTQMLHDGSVEYKRVVSYMRRIRRARTAYQARHLAEQCLREI